MKKMKLFYGILIGLLIFSSCSSDDESNSSSPSIIGSWKELRQTNFCSSGGPEIVNATTCEQTGKLIFNADGTYTRTYYHIIGGVCDLDEEENGTWEVANGILNIANQSGSFQFTNFKIMQNTLKIGADEDSVDPDPCGNGVLTSFTFDFERVE